MHKTGLEPVRLQVALDFKSNVSANSTTHANSHRELLWLQDFKDFTVQTDKAPRSPFMHIISPCLDLSYNQPTS